MKVSTPDRLEGDDPASERLREWVDRLSETVGELQRVRVPEVATRENVADADLRKLVMDLIARVDKWEPPMGSKPEPSKSRLNVEQITERTLLDTDWNELSKLWNEPTREALKFSSSDEVYRCFGKPSNEAYTATETA